MGRGHEDGGGLRAEGWHALDALSPRQTALRNIWALETGQTLALRPPPQPPIHGQVDSSQEDRGDGAFLPPTLFWSLARVLRLAA